ncbi:recombinase family protein [Actinomadura rudentiformis]|uniref:Recombinase family protein n=1 Tax=Actinomadura rudentiformis TaxID=359158 RepID=A0A6H9YHU3_9ACTN|nr:recombinase family protein [Actinomadura rudentiformis]KAB2341883.1 recombinase family protein [Actinomadura rudentiformis]
MNTARLHAVPEEPPRVVGYVRVSTAREEMISPELQRAAIEDYCTRRGYILDEVIEDLDATGRNFTRKGVQKAIERVENSGAAVVVVWKFSRFGRDRKGWAINLDRVESVGGRLESATEDVDASTSTGRFTRGMLSEIAAWESERIGDQWREAHERRVKMGLPHDGRDRFGYLYHRRATAAVSCAQGCALGECEPGYVIDPETAPFAAEMYERYNGGQSHRAIAIWLNSQGIKTTVDKWWTDRTVRKYLATGFAAGKIRVHDRVCKCKSPQTCERNAYLPGAHKPIIDEKVWEFFQRNRNRRAKLAPRVETPVYPLSGLLLCGRCDGPLNCHGIKHHGVYKQGYMYYCARYHRARLCEGTWIARPRLESLILDWIEEVAAVDVNTKAELMTARAAARTAADAGRKRLLREGQQLAKALTQLTVDRAKGLVPEAAYREARDELVADQERVQNALESLADEKDRLADPPVRVARDLVKRWPTLPPAVRRDLLSKLVKQVTVTSHGQGTADVELLTTWGEVVSL